MTATTITSFDNGSHREQVIALWRAVFGYATAHSDPHLAIDRRIAVRDDLFFVALVDGDIVGTIMAGYDGHRGWIHSIAVQPDHRNQGIGSDLVAHADRELTERGCMKVNLQIMEGNERVAAFYSSLGYSVEKRVSMGKRFNENIPVA